MPTAGVRSVDWRRSLQAWVMVKESIEEELDALSESLPQPIFAE